MDGEIGWRSAWMVDERMNGWIGELDGYTGECMLCHRSELRSGGRKIPVFLPDAAVSSF